MPPWARWSSPWLARGGGVLLYRPVPGIDVSGSGDAGEGQSHLVQMLAGIETEVTAGSKAARSSAGPLVRRRVERLAQARAFERRGRFLMRALRLGSPMLVLWFGGLQVLNGSPVSENARVERARGRVPHPHFDALLHRAHAADAAQFTSSASTTCSRPRPSRTRARCPEPGVFPARSNWRRCPSATARTRRRGCGISR